ncbi:hypothetical protein BT63DRAFT_380457 [Microthyrium microscopicum]|uniref:Uncharacterized protein n=1 Tax=Microthyrium microscopicum TaxID=703497 RepID=A0A6A6TT29_9PEZI|nr:hypothetical protein BT63DRAFT_380457 [Microthyrium microscopicum]
MRSTVLLYALLPILCLAIGPPITVTGTSQPDAIYKSPYIDVDEQRTKPHVHRYIHGGFNGTEHRFSFYFPPASIYENRFFQGLPAVPGNENAMLEPTRLGGVIDDIMPFAFESGGYVVESNQGSKTMLGMGNPAKANAAAAILSREVARQVYGKEGRVYGYVFGGSGGGYKTISAVEITDAFDGAVPFIIGSPASIPNVFSVQGHAMRLLDGKFDEIVDAIEPGGSGDMYAGLNQEQKDALLEVTRMGFPPHAWFRQKKIATGYTGVFASLLDIVRMVDPTYFTDYWTKPGYLGYEMPESLRKARFNATTRIKKVIMTKEAMDRGLPVSLSGARGSGKEESPAAFGATLKFLSGSGKDGEVYISGLVEKDIVTFGFGVLGEGKIRSVKEGDSIQLDNSVYLAALTYHRHQDPGPLYTVWNQFKNEDGSYKYPQRKVEMSKLPLSGSGSVQSGKFNAKMIVIEAGYDEAAYPWQADWYRTAVLMNQGEKADEHFRLWVVDKAMHTSPDQPKKNDPKPAENTRIVSYTPVIQQALRDLVLWVEKGVTPPPNSNYTVNDGQVLLPATAAERLSVQPVVNLKVNGKDRADVAVGQPVEFIGTVEVPPPTGTITTTKFDFEGDGTFPVTVAFEKTGYYTAQVKTTYKFAKAGTYFPALMGIAQRNTTSQFGKVANLGRVRIVVK